MKKLLSLLMVGFGLSCSGMELPLADLVKEILTNPDHCWKHPQLCSDISKILSRYYLRNHPIEKWGIRGIGDIKLEQALVLTVLYEFDQLKRTMKQRGQSLTHDMIIFDFSKYPSHVKSIFDSLPEPARKKVDPFETQKEFYEALNTDNVERFAELLKNPDISPVEFLVRLIRLYVGESKQEQQELLRQKISICTRKIPLGEGMWLSTDRLRFFIWFADNKKYAWPESFITLTGCLKADSRVAYLYEPTNEAVRTRDINRFNELLRDARVARPVLLKKLIGAYVGDVTKEEHELFKEKISMCAQDIHTTSWCWLSPETLKLFIQHADNKKYDWPKSFITLAEFLKTDSRVAHLYPRSEVSTLGYGKKLLIGGALLGVAACTLWWLNKKPRKESEKKADPQDSIGVT